MLFEKNSFPVNTCQMLKLIFLLTPVYVTLFWTIALNFYSQKQYAPKVFLGKFMFISFVLYLSHFFYFSGQLSTYYYLDSFYMLASLLVFPMYHIYIRLLTVERKFTLRNHIRFLALPILMFFFYLPGVLLMSPAEHEQFVRNTIGGEVIYEPVQLYLLSVYFISRVVFVVQVIYYLFANFRLIINNNELLQDYYSNTESRRLKWVQFFNISLAITSLAGVAAAITGREAFASGTYSLAGPSIVFSLMLFFIGLLGNTQNSVHIKEELPPKQSNQQEDQGNTSISTAHLRAKLDELFITEKIYTDPDLKIWDLSQRIGTNRTYISRFINSEYKRNFCNHVNYYRIQHVKQLLEENSEADNDQLAELSGFGSINSLYRAFQSVESISLSNFRKKQFKDRENNKA